MLFQLFISLKRCIKLQKFQSQEQKKISNSCFDLMKFDVLAPSHLFYLKLVLKEHYLNEEKASSKIILKKTTDKFCKIMLRKSSYYHPSRQRALKIPSTKLRIFDCVSSPCNPFYINFIIYSGRRSMGSRVMGSIS